MGILVPFHAAASRLAARSASNSAVMPASRARGSPSKADHHSAGMESRWRHFNTVHSDVPSSAPMTRELGHRSITSVKHEIDMPAMLGRAVLDCKPKSSRDMPVDSGQTVPMLSRKEFRRGFIQRTREARSSVGLSASEVARRLGIDQGTYKNYEINRPLPHEYVLPFCEICGIVPVDLYALPARFRDKEAAQQFRQFRANKTG